MNKPSKGVVTGASGASPSPPAQTVHSGRESELFLRAFPETDFGEEHLPEPVREEDPEQPGRRVERNPVGDGEYLVKQGDCMASIAVGTGHFWRTIWDDQGNSKVKAVRKDPYLLLPGDRIHIPPIHPKTVSGATETRHRFRRKGVPEKFRIRLLDVENNPLSGVRCILVIDEAMREIVTTEEGNINVAIPPNARKGSIMVPELGETIPFNLGGLDPIVEFTGVQQRLENLGYFAGPADGKWSAEFEQALCDFQEDNELKVTGEIDDSTRNKLRDQYGE